MDRVTNNLFKALDRCKIFKEAGVRDFTRSPFTFVCGVVNHGGIPFALVVRVGFERTINGELAIFCKGTVNRRGNARLPFTATRSVSALRVSDSGSDPVTVLFVIPFLGLLSIYGRIILESIDHTR